MKVYLFAVAALTCQCLGALWKLYLKEPSNENPASMLKLSAKVSNWTIEQLLYMSECPFVKIDLLRHERTISELERSCITGAVLIRRGCSIHDDPVYYDIPFGGSIVAAYKHWVQ